MNHEWRQETWTVTELMRNTVIMILQICLKMMVTRLYSFDQNFYIAHQDVSNTQKK